MYYRSGFAFSELHFMFVESKLWAAHLGASCQSQDAPKSWTKIIPSPLLRYPIPSPIQSALFSIQAGHCFPFIEQTRMKIYRRGV